MPSRRLFTCSSCGLTQEDSDGACLYCGSPTIPVGEEVDILKALERGLSRRKRRLPVFPRWSGEHSYT